MHPDHPMRRRPVRVLVAPLAFVALTLGIGACSSSSNTATTPATTAPAKKVFRETDTDISVSPGEAFAIRVKSTPSTGEEWKVTTEADPKIAKLEKQSFLALPDTKPGAPGREDFSFKAGSAGVTTFAIQNCLHCKTGDTTPSTGPSGVPVTPPGTATFAPSTYTFTIRVG